MNLSDNHTQICLSQSVEPLPCGRGWGFQQDALTAFPVFRESPEHLSLTWFLPGPCFVPSIYPQSHPAYSGTPTGSFLDSIHVPLHFAFSAGSGCFCCILCASDFSCFELLASPLVLAAGDFGGWGWTPVGHTGRTLAPGSAVLLPKGRKQGLLCALVGESHLPKALGKMSGFGLMLQELGLTLELLWLILLIYL